MDKAVNDRMVEGKVRDFLAVDVNFIEPGLVLVEKEHHLKNQHGAAGYVDILAKDPFGNFVVIEIKRSQQSSRQAIQELFKYIALLKQNYHARESEIRCIIISTHWGELLVPFSELMTQTSLAVKGLQIELDQLHRPVVQKLVQPIAVAALRRDFSPAYSFDLFFTAEKRDAAIPRLEAACAALGLKDFVILKMDVNTAPGKRVFYRYATCLAFQALHISTYLDMLKHSEVVDNEADDFDDEASYKFYLEECVQCALYLGREWVDYTDVGSPEKLEAELALDNWFTAGTIRHGVFALDPRYDDEMLLNELRGLNGSNAVKYFNVCESTHHDRLTEIIENCKNTLKNNQNWEQHIGQIFNYLQAQQSKYRLILYIFSPSSVFEGLFRMMMGEAYDFMPQYLLFADFIEKDELIVFEGKLAWDGLPINKQEITEFLENDKDAFMTKLIDSVMGHHEKKLIKLFHLKHQHTITKFQAGQEQERKTFHFDGLQIKKTKTHNQTPMDCLLQNEGLCQWILQAASSQIHI
jgi:hypothetical protein